MSWLETGTNMLYVLFMFYYFPSLCFDRLQVTEYHCFFSDNFYFHAFVNHFKVYILQLLYVNVQSLQFSCRCECTTYNLFSVPLFQFTNRYESTRTPRQIKRSLYSTKCQQKKYIVILEDKI
jgi:hypothetical protein